MARDLLVHTGKDLEAVSATGTSSPLYELIATLIPERSRVLDLGCGNGQLLALLIARKRVHGHGVEINEANVHACIARGLSVLQGDIDEGLADYPNGSFDYVILNQTIHLVDRPEQLMAEMLRAGRRSIISFPNFAYWRNRLTLAFNGRLSQPHLIPGKDSQRHNSIGHPMTIAEFTEYCDAAGLDILQSYYFNEKEQPIRPVLPNLLARNALFVTAPKVR